MRNHIKPQKPSKNSEYEKPRTKPRMTPYERPHNKLDVEYISDEDRSYIVQNLTGDWDAHD